MEDHPLAAVRANPAEALSDHMRFEWLQDAVEHPLWPAIAAMLQPAADYGDIDAYEDGDFIWIAHAGGTVFGAVVVRPLDHECEVRLAAGTRHRDWLHLLDREVSRWARDNQATRVVWRGRKGWARYVRAFGWGVLGEDDAGRTMFEKGL